MNCARTVIMKEFSLLFCIFLLCYNLKISAQEQSYSFPKIETYINVPISIPLTEINSLINKSVKGVIYEDNSFTDNDNDQFKVKVIKNGEISLTAQKGNNLLISVPLKIWAEKGYGAFGHYAYQRTNFEVKMKFIASVVFKNDWTIASYTIDHGFEWIEKPVLNFGGVRIPITTLVESSLKEKQQEFTTVIDKNIAESIELKPHLLNIWNQFTMPFQISEEYNSWLKLTPFSVDMSPVKINPELIKTDISIKLFSETFVGYIPAPSPLAMDLPDFNLMEESPRNFHLRTTANVPYEQATNIAKQQFVNYEFEMAENKMVRIDDIKVYYEHQEIAIEVDTSGELKGKIIISGKPYYDEKSRKIKLRNSRLKVKTSNLLHKAALLFFKGKIRKTIVEEYGIPLSEIEDEAKKGLLLSFNKEYYPGIFLKGRVLELKPEQILLFEDYITVVIRTHANLRLDVKELNF